jgi:hypothetical protein
LEEDAYLPRGEILSEIEIIAGQTKLLNILYIFRESNENHYQNYFL